MPYPPPVSDDEKHMLRILSRRGPSNPIKWEDFESFADLPPSVFGNGIAHLVAGDLIDVAEAKQGFFKAVFGAEPSRFVFVTSAGAAYLQNFGQTTAEEDARDSALNESPEDRRSAIEEAVRVFDDSFSTSPIYSSDKLAEAKARLDEDIKEEIKVAALEREKMWEVFQDKFGHRGPASSEEQASFRDPVIKTTTVRIFRAKDEQLQRLNLPASRKPGAWVTHYNSGDVGLEPAPWQNAI